MESAVKQGTRDDQAGRHDPRPFPAGPFPHDPDTGDLPAGRPAGPVGPLPASFAAPAERASKPAPTPQPGLLDRLARRFSLRLRVFAMFALVAGGTMAALAAGLAFGYARLPTGLQDDPDLRAGFMQAAILGGFLILGLVAWIWWLFDRHVAGAVEKLAATLRVSADAGAPGSIAPETARYLGDLAPAISDAARHLGECRIALCDAISEATQQLTREKAWLETLLADVPAAVLVCSADHEIVFYNAPAAEILGAEVGPGLARPVGDFLADEPIRRAHARLSATRGPQAHADLLCTSRDGSLVLEGRMRLVGREGEVQDGGVQDGEVQDGGVQDLEPGPRPDAAGGGYVLSLADVTATHAAAAEREARIARALPRLHEARRALRDGDGDAARITQDAAAILAELTHLLADAPTLSELRSADLADALQARLAGRGIALSVAGPDLFLRVDGYGFLAMLAHILRRLADDAARAGFVLTTIEEDGPGAALALSWQGAPLCEEALADWCAEPIDPETPELTAAMVLARHGSALAPVDDGWGLRIALRRARRAVAPPAPLRRSTVYDFALLDRARSAGIAQSALNDLAYVVFDTETTGLDPERDEIVQLAALRVVNGRIVDGEVFETLIDPQRPIPPGATAVHGITPQMVIGAPHIGEAGARFHRFAAGAVLVAHNAPFDMAFLRRHEAIICQRFDNPILDTVLASAVLFGQGESHSLDALASRFGIIIPEAARHTALGDAEATAQALVRMLPMLRARGFTRFGDLVGEMRKHGRLLQDLN
ncbi:MAG: DNA polymerase III subunit epsilon [Saliniramus fredricksonii]|uniref:DNA-directed DNA polymerase n=1 Tax=Saliniramus fredricksonii TaxID=1653334 RepID=A0A0P7XT41_9HYPH|nr:exonuclease domain-containing protein [Saliniramus fredricksonii]KPQ10684.1 MAG: DNA polymerase III subunit epsilon [Saliniramus fredricksonii]SCC79611.1 DNA polymerase-3 subunit epsilon [Saliniramus fredricksonii]